MTIVKDDLTPCTDRNDSILQQDRLFIGVYPTGIAYADKQNKVNGDYQRLAFLRFATLELVIEGFCPTELESRIRSHAALLQAKQGEAFSISAAGQTVTLGPVL